MAQRRAALVGPTTSAPDSRARAWPARAPCSGLVRVLAALLLFACDRPAGPPPPAGADEGPPVYGGTVVIAGPHDLQELNSLVASDVYTNEFLRYALFTTLIQYDENLEYTPYLARSWELLGDTGVVFHLRDDVYWHDGRRTTAYDVAFTYERAKDPLTAFPNAEYFEHWRDVVVVDSFTVRFRFEPHADPLMGWTEVAIMPRHLLESVPPARLRQAEFNRRPIGNGPFRFVSARSNDRWVFEANPAFPEELGGRPYLDRVVWRVIKENASQLAELRAGSVDVITMVRAEQLEELERTPGIRTILQPTRRYAVIAWNGKRPPLNDARVRRALAMLIDRQRIVDLLRGGRDRLAASPFPPSHWAHDASLEPLPYDPAAAAALLAEAGFRDIDGDGILEDPGGKDFTIELKVAAGVEFQRDAAELVRADLAAGGVKLTTRPAEWLTLIGDITSPERRFDAVLLEWQTDVRANFRDLFHSATLEGPYHVTSYSNLEVDRILDEAPRITDRERALPLWRRFQEIMREEQPWTLLYYPSDIFAVKERVKGIEMDARGAFRTLARWWIAGQRPADAPAGEPSDDVAPEPEQAAT